MIKEKLFFSCCIELVLTNEDSRIFAINVNVATVMKFDNICVHIVYS